MNTALPVTGRFPVEEWARIINLPPEFKLVPGVVVDAASFWRTIEGLHPPGTVIHGIVLNPPKKAK